MVTYLALPGLDMLAVTGIKAYMVLVICQERACSALHLHVCILSSFRFLDLTFRLVCLNALYPASLGGTNTSVVRITASILVVLALNYATVNSCLHRMTNLTVMAQ